MAKFSYRRNPNKKNTLEAFTGSIWIAQCRDNSDPRLSSSWLDIRGIELESIKGMSGNTFKSKHTSDRHILASNLARIYAMRYPE